jgi:hypothetical protein
MSSNRSTLAIACALIGATVAIGCAGHPNPGPTPAPTTHATTGSPTVKPSSKPPTAPTTRPPTSPSAGGDSKAISTEQRNATRSAQGYLTDQHFSRKGLIDQLKYEKYSTKAATAAVDSLDMDWNEQAALTARDYLSSQPFSRGSMIDQLKYDGFTTSQATYGAKKAGL